LVETCAESGNSRSPSTRVETSSASTAVILPARVSACDPASGGARRDLLSATVAYAAMARRRRRDSAAVAAVRASGAGTRHGIRIHVERTRPPSRRDAMAIVVGIDGRRSPTSTISSASSLLRSAARSASSNCGATGSCARCGAARARVRR
jgi:hypothetical protein